MSQIGYEIECGEFPQELVDEVEGWYQAGKSATEMLIPNPNEPTRQVYIAILNGHGSVIIISPDAWQQVYSHARDRDSKVKVRRYHICKRRDKTTTPYLKKDQAVSATFLLQAQLQPVASTNLTDDQLDRLALFCRRKFTVYQLIRQDCLQFAKSMTIQIAVSENGRSLDDVAEELGNLRVLDSGHSSASSEPKSRRHLGWPKAYVPAYLGVAGAFMNRNANYIAVTLIIVSASYLVLKYYSSWFYS